MTEPVSPIGNDLLALAHDIDQIVGGPMAGAAGLGVDLTTLNECRERLVIVAMRIRQVADGINVEPVREYHNPHEGKTT